MENSGAVLKELARLGVRLRADFSRSITLPLSRIPSAYVNFIGNLSVIPAIKEF